jgi:hypothetical protein
MLFFPSCGLFPHDPVQSYNLKHEKILFSSGPYTLKTWAVTILQIFLLHSIANGVSSRRIILWQCDTFLVPDVDLGCGGYDGVCPLFANLFSKCFSRVTAVST